MADIDAVDNHMGRVVIVRHAFVGTASSCDACGMLRIHTNHKGYDYDTAATHTEECVPFTPLGCKCPAIASEVKPDHTETIAEEASRIVYGDREQTYDDPYSNFQRIAHMWTGTLLKKLAPGTQITARDVALCMMQVKVARESHKPSRDNRVDTIGYTLCLDRIVQAEDETHDAE